MKSSDTVRLSGIDAEGLSTEQIIGTRSGKDDEFVLILEISLILSVSLVIESIILTKAA